jgi:GNAT superfamily N-acetyltransferase
MDVIHIGGSTMAEAPALTRELLLQIEGMVANGASNGFIENTRPSEREMARFGECMAVRSKRGRPANAVFCFGPENLPQLEDVRAFYAGDGLEPTFFLTPMRMTKEVAAALTAAGFGQTRYGQALLYGTPDKEPTALPAGISIEPVTLENLEDFVTATAEGNEWKSDWLEGAKASLRRAGIREDSQRFIVRYEGAAAGVGALGRVGEIASLGGAAVVPKFRGKGCHTALLHHRLYRAHEWGCRVAIAGAGFGSVSFYNQQRMGFRLAYVESVWGRVEGERH